MKNQNGPELLWDFCERALDIYRFGGALGDISGGRPGVLWQALLSPAFPATKDVVAGVHRHSMQPGAQGGIPPEGRELPKSSEEGLLGGVSGVLGASQHAQRQVVDPLFVAPYELLESGGVPLGEESNELLIRGLQASGRGRLAD